MENKKRRGTAQKRDTGAGREKYIVLHRVFFNAAAEEKWLDSLGAQGLLLVRTAPFAYYFEKRGGAWTYSLEWLDSSPLTIENAEYVKSRSGRDVFCGAKNCWVYFASEKDCAHTAKHVASAKRRYLRVALFWAVVAALMVGLLVYNVIWANKFDAMEYTVKSGLFKDQNPARVFLWLVAPLTAVSALVCFYCFTVYAAYKKYAAGIVCAGDTEGEETGK